MPRHSAIVFAPEPIPPEAVARIRDTAEVRQGASGRGLSEDDLARAVGDVDALLITSREAVSAKVIAAAPRLKVITKAGARPDNVDFAAARERAIHVTWTPGANAVSVAEFTITLLLAVAKRLADLTARLRDGGWRDASLLGWELAGKTAGLIGLGHVGAAVAQRLRAFGMEVLAHDPQVGPAEFRAAGAAPATLDDLLARADMVSLHCALTRETRGLIDESALRRMKRTAILLNTARGALVDEAALQRALEQGWIGGAGLDVYTLEPPASPLFVAGLPNVIATPHVAAFTHESIARETIWAVEDIRALLRGEPPVHWKPE